MHKQKVSCLNVWDDWSGVGIWRACRVQWFGRWRYSGTIAYNIDWNGFPSHNKLNTVLGYCTFLNKFIIFAFKNVWSLLMYMNTHICTFLAKSNYWSKKNLSFLLISCPRPLCFWGIYYAMHSFRISYNLKSI